MRNVILLLFLTASIYTTAQSLQTLTIRDNTFEYQTVGNGPVNVILDYESTSMDISDESLRTLIVLSTYAVKSGLKSTRSFVPISYTVKYKHHKKGKHRYSVAVYYTGTNSYGGEINDLVTLQFNSKFKETLGSVMLRN